MSRIRPRGTGLELRVFALLRRAGIRFRRHVAVIPRCTPDLLLPRARAVVFIHGDFWHGWRFPAWEHKLAPFWRTKIAVNRARDRRNGRRLRSAGWHVIRVWEHQIERDPEAVLATITRAAKAPLLRPRLAKARASVQLR